MKATKSRLLEQRVMGKETTILKYLLCNNQYIAVLLTNTFLFNFVRQQNCGPFLVFPITVNYLKLDTTSTKQTHPFHNLVSIIAL